MAEGRVVGRVVEKEAAEKEVVKGEEKEEVKEVGMAVGMAAEKVVAMAEMGVVGKVAEVVVVVMRGEVRGIQTQRLPPLHPSRH